jgi:Fe2+ transport system protein FeoA
LTTATDILTRRIIPLTQLKRGQRGVVSEARTDADSKALLGAMGLRPNEPIRMCRHGEPCIVMTGACESCRIGLTRRLADLVFVEVAMESRGAGSA